VCRMRDTPVIVFINKLDRDGKPPFDLLDEIEKELNIHLHPLSWPINMGKEFKGVYNLYDKSLLLFNPNQKATDEDIVPLKNMGDPLLTQLVGEKDAAHLKEDVELIQGVYGDFDAGPYLEGKAAPILE
jgi:peptide chain release factor 3